MPSPAQRRSANDRLKDRADDVVALSLVAAAGLHFLAFQMWPEMSAPDWGSPEPDSVVVLQLDELPIPARPEPLSRPAAPIPTDDPAVEATLDIVPFDRVDELPLPPPPDVETRVDDRPPFVPFDVPPRLTNPDELERALLRVYPSALRDAGVGGTVMLLAHIDEEGRLLEARIGTSSGYARLDEAALGLADVMRFDPAQNRDRRVAVWVSLPIEFRTR